MNDNEGRNLCVILLCSMKMKEMLSSSSSSSSSSKVRMEEEEGEEGGSQTTSGERLGLEGVTWHDKILIGLELTCLHFLLEGSKL